MVKMFKYAPKIVILSETRCSEDIQDIILLGAVLLTGIRGEGLKMMLPILWVIVM